ncbi:MAG: DUF4249 family protein [Bacteroidales bacterium]|nr:DUF4249 family protein [Bacteroidales bacterium]
MKKYLSCLLSVVLLTACEEELAIIDLNEEKQLSVNALIDVSQPVHRIYCDYVVGGKATPVSDAEVELSVNGQWVESLTPCDTLPGVYLSTCTLHSGDTVRLRVSTPTQYDEAWAEAIVPAPILVTEASADIEYQSFFQSESLPYYRSALSLQKQSSSDTYGRLLAGVRVTNVYGWVEMDFSNGEILSEQPDSLTCDSLYEVRVLDDLCLTQGKGYVENPENDMLGYNVVWQNHYHLFSDRYFEDNAYRMHYYTSRQSVSNLKFSLLDNDSHTIYNRNHPLYGCRYKVLKSSADGRFKTILYGKRCDVALFYQLYSIEASEYYYLQTLSSEMDLADTNMAYAKPRFLPQNVHHAFGFFAIENCTRGWITGCGEE